MTECFELADKMIIANARVSKTKEYEKFHVTLTEPDCADSKVTIRNIPDRSIVLRLDGCVNLSGIFNGTLGECKRSDYVVVAERNEEIVIVHIEMKRTNAAMNAVCKQLAGSQCFVNYMQLLGQVFGQRKEFLQSAKHRFVYFGHTGPQKRATRINRDNGIHDSPEKPLRVDYADKVFFAMIAGGN